MELKKYFNYFLKSYLISFFFFNNYKNIIFIKKLKIIFFLKKRKKFIFLIFIIFFFLFNEKIWFKNKKYNNIEIDLSNDKIFYFLQFFSLSLLSIINRNVNVNFKINNSYLYNNFNLYNFFYSYQNNFLIYNIFKFINKVIFTFFLKHYSIKLKYFLLRLFLLPINTN